MSPNVRMYCSGSAAWGDAGPASQLRVGSSGPRDFCAKVVVHVAATNSISNSKPGETTLSFYGVSG